MKSKKASIEIDPEQFEKDNGVSGKFRFKERKTWKISPVVRVHEPKNEKKKNRSERKSIARKAKLGLIEE